MLSPTGYIDIIRMYDEMHTLRILGWDGLNEYNEAPLSKLYLYLISLTGSNHLLSIVNCFFVYFLLLYIIYKVGNKLKIADRINCLGILFIAMSIKYATVNTNIRHPLAITIFFVILMYDLIGHKNRVCCLIGYIVSILLHPSMIILLCIRIISRFSLKYSIIIIGFLGFICINYWEDIPSIILSFTNIDFIVGLVAKQQVYTLRAQDDIEIYSTYWKISSLMINMLGIIFSVLLMKYLTPLLYTRFKVLIRMNILVSLIGFVLIVLTPESGGRIESVVLYTVAIYFYIVSNKENFKLSAIGYNNLKIVLLGLLPLWLIYFVYFNIYLFTKYFSFKFFV